MATYDVGDTVRLTGTFTNAGGTATDPGGTVSIKVLDPSGTTTTYTGGSVVNSATGVYYTDVAATKSGRYHWRCEANGTGNYGAEEGYFDVSMSRF